MGKIDVQRVEVRPCKIGRGVFALKKMRRGQNVGEIEGVIVVGLEHSTPYCIELDEIRSLEPGAPFRFLNHSCEPNCEIYSWDEPGGRDRVYLQTLRTIQPGEELTIDYAWHADAAIRCQCGTAGCRGWIVDQEQLPELLKRHNRRKKRSLSKSK